MFIVGDPHDGTSKDVQHKWQLWDPFSCFFFSFFGRKLRAEKLAPILRDVSDELGYEPEIGPEASPTQVELRD